MMGPKMIKTENYIHIFPEKYLFKKNLGPKNNLGFHQNLSHKNNRMGK